MSKQDSGSYSICFEFEGTQQCEESNMFQCQDGSCLSKEKVCDGIFDCSQDEDELQCERKVHKKHYIKDKLLTPTHL